MLSARYSHGRGPKLFEGEKGAARLKIKQEKTFQRELFTGHDSGGASDVPLQPGPRVQNALPSLFFFIPRITERSNIDPVAVLVLLSL